MSTIEERVRERIRMLRGAEVGVRNVVVWEAMDKPDSGKYPVNVRAVIYWEDHKMVSIYNGTLVSGDLVMDGLLDFSAQEFRQMMDAMSTYL